MLTAVPAGAGTLETPWTDGEGARARLIASSVIGPDGRPLLLAGLQIELDEGWKTYWRTPGDDGGMPPELDWDLSRNLSSVEALYPAPGRFKGIMGYAIGYKHAVVLPFVLDPASTDREVTFHLGVVYGVCKDICVPKEAELAVALKPGETASPEIRRVLEEAYAAVPARGGKGDGLPELVSSRRVEAEGGPALELVARYPAGSEGADLFVEAV
ncbi:MAG: protein-disulfide reductase DsbD family protein, partial [Hyphomicrobiaceae bacterium]